MNREAAEKRGRGAETLAAVWLRLHGWRILARRARVPGGEVDIVARRGRVLAFVEVKARRRPKLRACRSTPGGFAASSSPRSGSRRAT